MVKTSFGWSDSRHGAYGRVSCLFLLQSWRLPRWSLRPRQLWRWTGRDRRYLTVIPVGSTWAYTGQCRLFKTCSFWKSELMLRPGDSFQTLRSWKINSKNSKRTSVNLHDLYQTEGQQITYKVNTWPGHHEDPGLSSSPACGFLREILSSGWVAAILTLHRAGLAIVQGGGTCT